MFLITTVRIPNGYRLLVAVPSSAPPYQWCLYRNGNPLAHPIATAWLDNVIAFELRTPLAPGPYALWLSVANRELLAPNPALPVLRAGLFTHPASAEAGWNWAPVEGMLALHLPA